MQGIVIQGPTNYCKQIVPVYENIPNVVWSTWDDEPLENINYIKNYFPIILNKKPLLSGCLNINMQTISTLKGINYLKEKGVTELLKIRGDIIITNLKLLLEILKGKEISFLAICKEGARPDLYYELVYPHHFHDYPVDLVVYGSVKNMINAFGFTIEEFIPIPPEALIAYNLLTGLKTDFILTYQHFIKNGISFFMEDCIKNNIKLKWLKNNLDLVDMHNDKQYYEF